MPKEGMYKCHWSESGICHFESIDNGFDQLQTRLEDYFHMDQPTENDLIEYYDRLAENLMVIRSQNDFNTALMHSSQTYSPFSLVLKVNAVRREDHWYNGDVAFNEFWRVSKPKFACIRSWLLSLEKEGNVCQDISETCSYSEKAFLFSQVTKIHGGDLTNQKVQFSTNQNVSVSNLHQSNPPKKTLTSIKGEDQFELLEGESENQKMLHEKMMMDPAISLILFNEYIPLQQPKKKSEIKIKIKTELCKEMGGLFLGKMEEEKKEEEKEEKKEEKKEEACESSGLFIRSEPDTSGGLFIRSEDSSSSPQCTTDDWVIA